MAADIPIVDDEADIRDLVPGILEDEGHSTRTHATPTKGPSPSRSAGLISSSPDIWLQVEAAPRSGLEMLSAIKKQHPDLPVVLASSSATATSRPRRRSGMAPTTTSRKPFKADRLVLVTLRKLSASSPPRGQDAARALRCRAPRWSAKSAASTSSAISSERVSPTNSRILIRGALGRRAELAARVIHAKSSRADGPFVVLNAAAMAPDQCRGGAIRYRGPLRAAKGWRARGSPRRHALYRRSRRHAARDAGQGPPASSSSRSSSALAVGRKSRVDADHFLDKSRSRAGDGRRSASAMTSTIASTWSSCACRALQSGGMTSRR